MKIIYSAALLLIFLLTVSECSSLQVVGVVGQDVTLPCRYDASYYGLLPMCWGRGALPSSGCDQQILSSDGSAVTSRSSSRYVLAGDLRQGEVSLTLLSTTESDAGLYGCRVHIPGWFNDQKTEVRLTVKKNFWPTPTRIPDHETVTPANHSQGHMTANSTESQDVSTSRSVSQSESSGHVALTVILVCVILLLLAIGALSLVCYGRRRTTLALPWSSGSSPHPRSSVSSQGLYSRDMALENIYQMDDADIYTNIFEG